MEISKRRLDKLQKSTVINIQSGSKNIIPEGALHKERHNLSIQNISKKGIPVIQEIDGVVEQFAEIEKNEIIFNLDFTKRAEYLTELYLSSDDALFKDRVALYLGRIATYEIIKNTKDNTNLTKSI